MKRFFSLIFWWKRKKQKQEKTVPENTVLPVEEHIAVPVPASQEDQKLQEQISIPEVKEEALTELVSNTIEIAPVYTQTCDAFQEYIIERCKDSGFELVARRNDRFYEEKYAATGRLPDLEYRATSNFHDLNIAMVCKWSAELIKGRVEWAKGHQMAFYRQYQHETGTTVFVAIGIGGKPGDPNDVYIIPLKDIRSNVLAEYQLKKYQRSKEGNFYFERSGMELA